MRWHSLWLPLFFKTEYVLNKFGVFLFNTAIKLNKMENTQAYKMF